MSTRRTVLYEVDSTLLKTIGEDFDGRVVGGDGDFIDEESVTIP